MVIPHHKHVNVVKVEPKILEATKNDTYESGPYTTVKVNVKPKLQEKTICNNGVVNPDPGFEALSKVTVSIPKTYSFAEDGYRLRRVKYNGQVYLALAKGTSEYPDYANTNSNFIISINADSQYFADLYPVNKNFFITDKKCDDYVIGDTVKVSVILFGSLKIFEEDMVISEEGSLV